MILIIILFLIVGFALGYFIGYSNTYNEIIDESFAAKSNNKKLEINYGKRKVQADVTFIGVD